MIRMGRNAKPEDPIRPEAAPVDLNKNTQAYGYAPASTETFNNGNAAAAATGTATAPRNSFETVQTHGRAMTDSESMARDIKEGRLSCFVGNGTLLTGETNFKAMLRVDGQLTGKITSDSGTLIVGTSGQIDANIVVAAAVIHGTINGDIVATERLELGRTAKVVGNIQTPSLMIEQGAVLEGNCSMMKQRADFDKRKEKSYQSNNTYTVGEKNDSEKTSVTDVNAQAVPELENASETVV